MGGNGLQSIYSGVHTMGSTKPSDIFPSAVAGGCVTAGLFKESATQHANHIYKAYILQYGRQSRNIWKIVWDIPNYPRSDGFGSNPQCLRCNVNNYAAAVTSASYTYALIVQYSKIDDHQQVMLGTPAKNTRLCIQESTIQYVT